MVVWSRRFAAGTEQPDLPVKVLQTPEDVAEASDIVSVHLALSKDTRGLLGESFFARMRKGAIFVNTARGEVVDYAALERPFEGVGSAPAWTSSRRARRRDGGLQHAARCAAWCVRHASRRRFDRSGAGSDRSRDGLVIASFVSTGKVPNVVNLARATPATHMLVVRHRDRPGVLAHVFDQLRRVGINVQETENIIFEGAEAAVARIHLDGSPASDVTRRYAQRERRYS